MGYHIFLSMVLRARAPLARAELRCYFAVFAAVFQQKQEKRLS